MGHLTENWLTNGWMDFEYKKYIILSYLKDVQQHFSAKKLYPVLNELAAHYKNLKQLHEEKLNIENRFPQNIIGLDIERQIIHYQKRTKDSDILEELEAIVEYGLILFHEKIEIGNDLVEKVKETITIEPIGISPLYEAEGYLFISSGNSGTVRIYEYMLSPLKDLGAGKERMRTRFVTTREKSISNTFEQIKREVVRTNNEMPNPATYSIHCSDDYPYLETYLPIARKMLETQIAA